MPTIRQCLVQAKMRFPIALLALCLAHGVIGADLFSNIIDAPGKIVSGAGNVLGGIFGGKNTNSCSRDASAEYRTATNAFYNQLYTHVAARNEYHFVFSPYNIWLSLSALAEGADSSVQSKLFTSLRLPQEKCIRMKFYDIALNVVPGGHDVFFDLQRNLVLDEGLKVNPSWASMISTTGLLKVAYAPIKSNPAKTSQLLRQMIATRSNIVLNGNSVLLDSIDYQGLWTTAFADANTERQPFFNEAGQKIGSVDMMRMKKRVRLAQVPFMNSKVLELPVGLNGKYTMLIAVGTGNNIIKNSIDVFMGSILQIFSLLQMSVIPLDIAIPRFSVSSEFNLRPALEEIGIREFWRNPAATRYVSNPPAAPGGLIQRVTVKVESHGAELPPTVGSDILSGLVNIASNTATGVASAVGHEFIANRPFMFALFDTKTHTCLFAGAYSKPEIH